MTQLEILEQYCVRTIKNKFFIQVVIEDEDKVAWKSYLEKALKLSLSITPLDPLAGYGMGQTVAQQEDDKLFTQALNHCKHQVRVGSRRGETGREE